MTIFMIGQLLAHLIVLVIILLKLSIIGCRYCYL